jgi:hypothetical protein
VLVLDNVATLDAYAPELTLEQDTADTVTYVVANNSARARFRPIAHRGGAEVPYGEEALLTPQTNSVRNISGAQFRSAEAGKPARVIAMLTGPLDPQLAAGTPFLQALSASGGIGAVGVAFRKTTPKVVTNDIAETDLFNNEFTLPGGTLGTTGYLRIQAWGDYVNNSAATRNGIRFRFKLGGVTIIDTGAFAAILAASPSRGGWKIAVDVFETDAPNAQWVNFDLRLGVQGAGIGGTSGLFTTGEGSWNGGAPAVLIGEGANQAAMDATVAQPVSLTAVNPTAIATFETKLAGALAEVV